MSYETIDGVDEIALLDDVVLDHSEGFQSKKSAHAKDKYTSAQNNVAEKKAAEKDKKDNGKTNIIEERVNEVPVNKTSDVVIETVAVSTVKEPSRTMLAIQSFPWESFIIGFIAILGALLVWQLLSYYQINIIISFENIPTPLIVAEQFANLLVTEEFYKHIGASLQRIGIAFSSASLFGVVIGIFMGRSKIFSGIMTPYIEILRPIPAVAWIPLAILMFPTEESSIIYITFLGAFFPVVLNTVHGVEQTPGSLIRAAESLGASKRSIMWHVILPGALPSIMAGLAIGMGVAWFSLLAGEIISGQYGIGYFTWNSYTLVEYPNIIIGMLTIGGLGTLSTWLVKKASIPALRWQEHSD